MEQRLTLLTLGVENLQRSASFYEQTFGWKRSPMSTNDIVFFSLNGILLSLFPIEELSKDATVTLKGNGITLAHNLRSETEVDNLFSELAQKGVWIVKHPEKVFWGGYSGYISDPDGYLWEIAYNPFLPMDEKGNTIP